MASNDFGDDYGTKEWAEKLGRQAKHKPVYDPSCIICKSPDKIDIEKDYEATDATQDIADRYNVAKSAIERHCRALDIDVLRVKNTYKTLAKLHDKGLERVESGLEAVTVDHLMRIIEHTDKREGRIINKVQVSKPTVIVMRGIPPPGAIEGETFAGEIAPEEQSDSISAPDEPLLLPSQTQVTAASEKEE